MWVFQFCKNPICRYTLMLIGKYSHRKMSYVLHGIVMPMCRPTENNQEKLPTLGYKHYRISESVYDLAQIGLFSWVGLIFSVTHNNFGFNSQLKFHTGSTGQNGGFSTTCEYSEIYRRRHQFQPFSMRGQRTLERNAKSVTIHTG